MKSNKSFLLTIFACLISASCFFAVEVIKAMELNYSKKLTPFIFAHQNNDTDDLLSQILHWNNNEALSSVAQVNWRCRNLVKWLTEIRYRNYLKGNKLPLFSDIVAVTDAELNEVQLGRDWLASFLNKSDDLEAALYNRLELVLKNLVQPEYLLIRNQVLREKLISEPSAESEVLAFLRKLINEIGLLRGENALLDKGLKRIHNYYQGYIDAFKRPTTKCDRHIRPKAILTGENFIHTSGYSTFPYYCSYRISQEKALELLPQYTGKLDNPSVKIIHQEGSVVSFREGSSMLAGLQVGTESALHNLRKVLFNKNTNPSALITLNEVDISMPPNNCSLSTNYALARHAGQSPTDFFAEHFLSEQHIEEKFTEKCSSHTLLAKNHVTGISLEQFINEVKQGNCSFNDLDMRSFSEHIIMSILTNPSDASSNAFIVTMDSKPYQLIYQGNEMLLGNPLVPVTTWDWLKKQKEIKHDILVKNVLYCLPLMDSYVDENVIKNFLQWSPELHILRWLSLLERDEKAYSALLTNYYNSDSSESFPYLKQGDYNSILGLPFKLSFSTLDSFKRLLKQIQALLQERKQLPHWQLLLKIQPLVAHFYQEVQKKLQVESAVEIYRLLNRQSTIKNLFVEDVLSNFTDKDQLILQALQQSQKPQPAFPTNELKQKLLANVDVLEQPASYLTEVVYQVQELDKELRENQLHEHWHDDRVLIHALAERVSPEVIRFLLDTIHVKPLAIDILGWTTLRHAVANHYTSSLLKKLVQSAQITLKNNLLTKGSGLTQSVVAQVVQFHLQKWINHQADDQLTALDEACLQKSVNSFISLISLGCTTCSSSHACEFYESIVRTSSNPALHKAFTQLITKNAELRWHLSLERIVPPCSSSDGYILSLPRRLNRCLPLELGQQITKDEKPTKAYAEQQQILDDTLHHGMYFSSYPDLPGIEYAAGLLTRLILGFGAPYVELAKLHYENKEVPVLLTQAPDNSDNTLAKALKEEGFLDKLDEGSLSGMILIAMLLNTEDGSPDNYLVEKNQNGPGHRIVTINNEHCFIPVTPKNGEDNVTVQSKTILHCLDQMNCSVAPEIRELFIHLDPYELLKKWLSELKKVNGDFIDLFGGDIDCFRIFRDHNCFIGIPFQVGFIKRLFDKITLLKDLLQEDPVIKHIDLLEKLEPVQAKKYREVLSFETLTPTERFSKICESSNQSNSCTTTKRVIALLRSVALPLKENIFEALWSGESYGPVKALRELKKASKEHKNKLAAGFEVVSKVDITFLKSLNLKEKNPSLRLDCKSLTPEQQELLLIVLHGKYLAELVLKNCNILTDKILTKQIPLNHLTRVNLRGCNEITSLALLALSRQALALKELNLAHIKTLKKIAHILLYKESDLFFPALQKLSLSNCTHLEKLLLKAPKLSYLNAKNCQLLSDTMLDGVIGECKFLETLLLEGASKISEIEIREQCPSNTLSQIRKYMSYVSDKEQ